MTNLLGAFPHPDDLLALAPEELGGLLMEIIPPISQPTGFLFGSLLQQFYRLDGSGYPRPRESEVALALAEAVEWLRYNGLIVRNPQQPAEWFLVTRRGKSLRAANGVAGYAKASLLPVRLLQPDLADKVHGLFARGDWDIAVFQAFKMVEVAVRAACAWGDEKYGVPLMRQAFHIETGPLRDSSKVPAERQAELELFAGAVGYAKNPTSHRDVGISREVAARLIVFASHLLDVVDGRGPRSSPPA